MEHVQRGYNFILKWMLIFQQSSDFERLWLHCPAKLRERCCHSVGIEGGKIGNRPWDRKFYLKRGALYKVNNLDVKGPYGRFYLLSKF